MVWNQNISKNTISIARDFYNYLFYKEINKDW